MTDTADSTDQDVPAMLSQVYRQLRAQAQQFLSNERSGHTLSATALVHEAYLKLVGPDGQRDFEKTAHFYHSAVEAMRRILIDYARGHKAQKRGGARQRMPADLLKNVAHLSSENAFEEMVALDEALSRLGGQDPQAAEVVKLRFYAGLTNDQAAKVLGISERTVKRDWQFARAWLFRELKAHA